MKIRQFTKEAIGLLIAFAFSTISHAQSTILVVDTGKVLKDSLVGQHVARQLETIISSAQSEMKAKTSPFETKAKSLQAQIKSKTSVEELRADAGLRAQAQSLQTDQQKLQLEAYYTCLLYTSPSPRDS